MTRRATRRELAHLFGKPASPVPMRVHFHDAEPLDVDAIDIADAREMAKAIRPGQIISKIKIARQG